METVTMETSQDLINPDQELSQDDEQFWSSLMNNVDRVKLGEQLGEGAAASTVEVAPKPAFCVKTKSKEKDEKTFLNICTCDKIPEPKKLSVEELVKLLDDEELLLASEYRIPMSIGDSCHAEVDKKGVGCSVYDIAIHPNYIKTVKDEPVFFNFFMQVVFEGLAAKFKIELDWEWIILKNRSHVGKILPHLIRTYRKPVIQEVDTPTPTATKTRKSSKHTQHAPTPDYIVLQEPIEGTPNYLIVEVWLPGIENSSKLTLDVGEDQLTLHAHPAKYFLDIELPYDVVPLESGAQFDTQQGLLTIAMMTKTAPTQ